MDKLDQDIPAPAGWATAWIDRDYEPLTWYTLAVIIVLSFSVAFIQMRASVHVRRAAKELDANPSDRTAIFAKLDKRAFKTSKHTFQIALAYMAHAIALTLVDSGIAVFVLYTDVKEHPDVWDKEMVTAVAFYVTWLLVLFAASFVLVPLLQMLAVTWALTRFSKKNTLSEYLPQARSISSPIALVWSGACFYITLYWPIAGDSEMTSMRFFVLEASWGSALAWLEAAFLFLYMSHAIGDKELSRGNGVGEVGAILLYDLLECTLTGMTDRLSLRDGRKEAIY